MNPEKRPCKACGAPLLLVRNEAGKIVPLDMRAHVYDAGPDLMGEIVAKRVGANLMVSHFFTCPKANDFSGGKKK